MSALYLRTFFPKLRAEDPSGYRKMSSEILSVVPFHSPIMFRSSSLSEEQSDALRAIFLRHGVPEGIIASPENIEEAFRIFYSGYVHDAPA
ncbi:hypothetical protein IJH66_02820 [Candidatus Saccharibacteria bacterium]|nr:hypothetical protein [Candidatus Saccharibacteria bacterium]MBQ6147651.1 hypothetical protein [Candidatus Saccharibacteria bacterium]MBQ6605882.1 hypothetical protein [Candidatus Saccharibacteria bacterium]